MKVSKKKMPNGYVSAQSVKDHAARAVIMMLNENILSLAAQVSNLQDIVSEIERKA
jgi:hypothetical protein